MNKNLRAAAVLFLMVATLAALPGVSQAAFEASDVLGHVSSGNPAFTLSGLNNSPNNEGLDIPKGVAVDVAGRRLFVADSNNYRVLVYALNADGTFLRHNPDYVLGQADLFATGGESVATSSAFATALAYDPVNDRLFAAETSRNRIMVFDVTSSTMANGKAASFVLGQADFSTTGFGTSSSTLSDVQALAYDSVNQRLFSAEGADGNRRVLVFDVAPGSMVSGKAASFVLGQPDFDAITNMGVVAADSIDDAEALAYDATDSRLFASDSTGRRVLVFDVAPGTLANDEAASFAIGAPDLTTAGSSGTSSSSVRGASGLAYDAATSRLFVSTANRVAVFDAATSTLADNEPASFVLGQATFTDNTAGTSATALDSAAHLSFDPTGTKLFVSDQGNHRVLAYDVASIANGEAAVDEVGHIIDGQTTFTYGGKNNGPGRVGFDSSSNVLVDEANHRLFVSDTNNERVMVFDLNNSNDLLDYEADNVLGEPDMYSQDPQDPSQDVLGGPRGLAYDASGNRLFVADAGNNRVMVYDVASISDGEPASFVLGQANFTDNSGDTSSTTLNNPYGLAYDASGNRLFVSDYQNNRVMVYDVASITNGEPAAFVLGQPDFDSSSGGTSSSTLSGPRGLAFDSNRLFVADEANNRVMVYDVASISDNEPAAFVIGQTDFDSAGSGTSSSTLNTPWGLGYDSRNKRIYVGDSNNSRVLGFNFATSSMENGKAASVVLGQDDFTSGTPGTSRTQIGIPDGIAYDASNRRIYVNDIGNNRIMAYNHIKITTLALPAATVGEAYAQEIDTESEQGTVSFELALGTLPPGMSVGSVDGTPTAAGTYTFTIQANDSVANAGQLFDNQEYSLVVNPVVAQSGGGGRHSSGNSRASSTPSSTTPSFEELQAQIAALTAQIAALQKQLGLKNGSAFGSGYVFTRDLKLGMSGADVKALQQFLNSKDCKVASAGPGSPGQETELFGSLTRDALKRLQEAYAAEILAPLGLLHGTGFFGGSTRTWVNAHI